MLPEETEEKRSYGCFVAVSNIVAIMPGHSQKQDEKAIEEEDILIRAAEQWELPEDHTSLEVPLEEFSQILAAASRKDKEEETDLVDMQRSLTKKRTSSRLHIETGTSFPG